MLKRPFNGTEIITNKFRPNGDPHGTHLGTDYALGYRTAIIAATGGKIIKSSYTLPKDKPQSQRQWVANTQSDPLKKVIWGKILTRSLTTADYGNFVKIDHGNNVATLYAHLDEIVVHEGEFVKEGQLIGYSDSTGNSTGNHLHYELRIMDVVINPDTFDYSFSGTFVSQESVNRMDEQVLITVDTLNVRHGPSRTEKLSGSRELHKGDTVEVLDWVHGENINGNDIWYVSKYNNYFWSGGTDMKGLPTKGEKSMTQMEHDQKLAELEARRASIEARKAELDDAVTRNTVDADIFRADWEAFATVPVEAYAVVEAVAEAPVETPLEAVETVAESTEEDKKAELESLYEKLKSLLGK